MSTPVTVGLRRDRRRSAGCGAKLGKGDDKPRRDDVIASLMRRVVDRRMLSLDFLLGLELTSRRMWGQPLSLRTWDRMTFNDKVTYRRLRVRDPVYRTYCDKLRMRAYVAERLGARSVPELLGVGEHPSRFAERTGPLCAEAESRVRAW